MITGMWQLSLQPGAKVTSMPGLSVLEVIFTFSVFTRSAQPESLRIL